MNIFYLDDDFKTCARFHADRHVVKMVLEYAQLLSTAHRELDGEENVNPILYKSTHKNHPCAIWARQTSDNYGMLYGMFYHLSKEYEYRYGKIHLSYVKLKYVLDLLPKNIPNAGPTELPQCMPDEYKVVGDPLQAYRNYYIGAKSNIAKWTKRSIPEWYIKKEIQNA